MGKWTDLWLCSVGEKVSGAGNVAEWNLEMNVGKAAREAQSTTWNINANACPQKFNTNLDWTCVIQDTLHVLSYLISPLALRVTNPRTTASEPSWFELRHLDSVRGSKGRPWLSPASIDEMFGRHAKILCKANGAVLTASALVPSIDWTHFKSVSSVLRIPKLVTALF